MDFVLALAILLLTICSDCQVDSDGTTNKGKYQVSTNLKVDFDLWNPAGDGITDDREKLIDALTYANKNNIDLVLNSDKVYYIGTALHYNFSGSIRIRSDNTNKKAVIKISDKSLFPFQIGALQKSGNVLVKATIKAGQKSITVSDGSSFAVGDYIGLSSETDWPLATNSEVQKGEWNIVESTAGNVLLLRYPMRDSYSLNEKLKISNWYYASLAINGVELVCNDTGNNSVVGISLRNLQNSQITNSVIRNFQTTGAEARACYNLEFDHNQVYGCNEVGMGYGFYPLAGFSYSIHDNTFTGGRKGVDAGGAGTLGPARDVEIYRNITYGSDVTSRKSNWFNLDVVGGQSMGYAVHEGAENVIFKENVCYNTCYGFQIRGRDVTVANNSVNGMCNFPFTTLAGCNHTYENNSYHSLLFQNATIKGRNIDYTKYPRAIFFSDASRPGQLIFKNNKADFARDFGVVLGGSKVLSDLVVSGNQYVFSTIDASSSPYTVYWSHITKPINKLVVKDNTATMATSGQRSSEMRLIRDGSYKNGSLINWLTCEVEGLKAEDVLTITASNSSVMTYKFTNLKIDKNARSIRLVGKINFKPSSSCRPNLVGIPTPATNDLFTFNCENDKKNYVGKYFKNSYAQFGKNESLFADIYKASATYTLNLDVTYTTN